MLLPRRGEGGYDGGGGDGGFLVRSSLLLSLLLLSLPHLLLVDLLLLVALPLLLMHLLLLLRLQSVRPPRPLRPPPRPLLLNLLASVLPNLGIGPGISADRSPSLLHGLLTRLHLLRIMLAGAVEIPSATSSPSPRRPRGRRRGTDDGE